MCGQRKGSHSSFPAAGHGPGCHPSTAQEGGESRADAPICRQPGRQGTPARHAGAGPAAAPGAAGHGAGQGIPPRRAGAPAHAARPAAHAARPPPSPAAELGAGAMIAPLRRPRRPGRAPTPRRARAAPAPHRQIMATGRFAVREPFRWPPRLSARDRSRRSSPTAAPPTAWVSSPGRDARRTCGAGREPFGIEEVDEMPTARPLLDLDHPAGGRAARVDHGGPLGLNGICHAVREGMCLGNVRCSAWLGGWAARRESGLGWRGLARIRLPGRDGGG